jgi:hypothetical protein
VLIDIVAPLHRTGVRSGQYRHRGQNTTQQDHIAGSEFLSASDSVKNMRLDVIWVNVP